MSESSILENSNIIKTAVLGIGITLVINLTIFTIGDVLGAFDKTINPGTDKQIGVMDVIQATITFLFLGTIVFFVVVKISENPQDLFKWVGIVAGGLSLGLPLTIEVSETVGLVFLWLMHIVSSTIFIYVMSYRLK